MKLWNVITLDIIGTHSLKLLMDKTGITGSWSQDPGLIIEQMNMIIMLRRILNDLFLNIGRRIAIIWIRINIESRVTKKDNIKKTNFSG